MVDIDPTRIADPTEFQTSECVDHTPVRDADSGLVPAAALSRRSVSSRDLPRFSRTSLQ